MPVIQNNESEQTESPQYPANTATPDFKKILGDGPGATAVANIGSLFNLHGIEETGGAVKSAVAETTRNSETIATFAEYGSTQAVILQKTYSDNEPDSPVMMIVTDKGTTSQKAIMSLSGDSVGILQEGDRLIVQNNPVLAQQIRQAVEGALSNGNLSPSEADALTVLSANAAPTPANTQSAETQSISK